MDLTNNSLNTASSNEPEEAPAWEPTELVDEPPEQEEVELGVVDADLINEIDASDWVFLVLSCGRRFQVKKSVMIKISAYFQALFRPATIVWLEVAEGAIYLQDWDLATFLVFAQWVNTKDVRDINPILECAIAASKVKDHSKGEVMKFAHDEEDENGKLSGLWASQTGICIEPHDPKLNLLTQAWKLGSYFLCPGFQNAIMNAIIHEHTIFNQTERTPLYNIHPIFEQEPASSPLRRFIFDSIRFSVEPEVYDIAIETGAFPPSLVVGLGRVSLGRYRLLQPDPNTYKSYTCDYHVNPDGAMVCPCPEPKFSSVVHRFDVNGNPW